MAKKYIVHVELDRDAHGKLKKMLRARRPRVYMKDYARELVLAAIRRAA